MSSNGSTTPQHSFLSRGLSVYSLPPILLQSLAVRSILPPSAEAGPSTLTAPRTDVSRTSITPASSGSALSCQTCPSASFSTPEEQRSHFKSDWHRYNAKARLAKKRVVDLDEFEGLVEGISSISGSEENDTYSEGSDEDGPPTGPGSGTDKVARLLKKSRITAGSTGHGDGAGAVAVAVATVDSDEEAEIADQRRRAVLRTALIWFTPAPLSELGIPADTQLGIHRALFPPFEKPDAYLSELAAMQLLNRPEIVQGEERRLTLLMVAGGHFAGMVVGLRPRGKNEKQDVKGSGEVRVLKSKTFHRYTTRKKQGGSQGLKDNAGSKAISAGAMLRRYGEQALQEEIRALLWEWEEDIHLSERIFLRASTHGKRSFWGYEGAILEKNDERLRVFPFPTRRPTIAELLRCWNELTRVKISHLTAEALQAQDDAYIASLQPKRQLVPKAALAPTPTPPAAPAVPKLSPEEEAKLDREKRFLDMIRKGRLDALRPFVSKYNTEVQALPSALSTAASTGQDEVLLYLLEEVRLDPGVTVDGKKAYDHAQNKGIRNVFRRVAFNHPEWWDWQAAHVPSGLSEEMEAEQDKKKNERRKGLREKMKEREKEKEAKAVDDTVSETAINEPPEKSSSTVPSQAITGPQKLGGRLGGDAGLAGLTPEMRMKIERERRARAAEARLK